MLTDVFEISSDTYLTALRFNIRTGGNLLVLGPAGTGKTEMAEQVCGEEGFEFIYLNLSVLEAPDLIGLPVVTAENIVDYAMPRFLPREGTLKKKKVLIVDELDKAKPELQNPLLELFQFHSINGNKLEIHAIIATGNLPDEGSFSQPISHALTNRCKVFKIKHDFDTWQEWAQNAGLNALVIGFLSKNRDWLAKPAAEGDPTAYCRPSPRAWSLAARDLDASMTGPKDMSSIEFQSLMVAGRVGMAGATKFRVWLDHYRHVEPMIDELVRNGTTPDQNKLTIDKLLVLCIGAAAEVSNAIRKEVADKDKAKHKEVVHKIAHNVFSYISKQSTDYQICSVKANFNMEMIQKFDLTKVKPVMDTFLAVRKVLKDPS